MTLVTFFISHISNFLKSGNLKPNSITLSGRRQARSWSKTC